MTFAPILLFMWLTALAQSRSAAYNARESWLQCSYLNAIETEMPSFNAFNVLELLLKCVRCVVDVLGYGDAVVHYKTSDLRQPLLSTPG